MASSPARFVRHGVGRNCSSNRRSSGHRSMGAAPQRSAGRISPPARRARVGRARVATHSRHRRDIEQLDHLRRFALPIVTEMADWPREPRWGWGRLAGDARRSRATRAAPSRAGPARLAGARTARRDVGPVSLREVREVLSPRLLTLTHDPPRRRHGRVFVGTPAAVARPIVSGRVRARSRRTRVSAAAARGCAAARRTTRPAEGAASATEATRGRRATAACAWRSARQPNARICPGPASSCRNRVSGCRPSTFSTSPAPSKDKFPPMPRSRSRVRRWWRHTRLARAGASRAGDRRVRARPVDAVSAAARRRSRARQRPRTLSLRAQPPPAALADRTLGTVAEALASGRWVDPHDAGDRAGARAAASRRTAVLAVRASALCRVSLSVPPVRDLQARAARRAGAVAAARSADARQPLSSESRRSSFARSRRTVCCRSTRRRVDAARKMLEWAIGTVSKQANDDLAPAIDRVWNDELASIARDLRGWLETARARRRAVDAGTLRVCVRPARRPRPRSALGRRTRRASMAAF